MKTVKIEIEIGVPYGYNFVAVSESGETYVSMLRPEPIEYNGCSGDWRAIDDDLETGCNVVNWRETLVEVE